jgi:ankyrin repeat protein
MGLLTAILLGTGTTGALAVDFTRRFAAKSEREFAHSVARGDVRDALARAAHLPNGVNTVGTDGETALFIAVKRADLVMVRALLSAGADPDGDASLSPLAAAVQNRDLRIARVLLRAGASPDGRIGDETALIRAALIGKQEAVDLLVSAGANLHLSNSVGVTATLFAASADHWTVVLHLLRAGADPLDTQKSGVTLAHYANHARNFETRHDRASFEIVKDLLRQAGLPAIPPSPAEVRRMRDIGEWPPAQ